MYCDAPVQYILPLEKYLQKKSKFHTLTISEPNRKRTRSLKSSHDKPCCVKTFLFYCDNLLLLQVSMLSKSFGEVGDPKGASTGTTGSQFLEQYKTAQALAQLAAQHSQTGPPNTTHSSWNTSGPSLGQYGEMTPYCNYSILSFDLFSQVKDNGIEKLNCCTGFFTNTFSSSLSLSDMKTQPEQAVHSPFTKRQPYQTGTSSMLDVFLQDKGLPPSSSSSPLPHAVPPPASSLPKMAAIPSLGQQVSPSSSDAHGSSPLPLHQHKLKQQKKRTSISTKVTTALNR